MPRILIVQSRFYQDIADEMVKGASEALQKAGATFDVIEVPGAFEIPAVIGYAIDTGNYDGYVALGCVIRGETSHYDYVCGESARGLMDLSLQHRAAIGYGILTVENEQQAHVRADVAQGNKGAQAVEACLAMLTIKHQFTSRS